MLECRRMLDWITSSAGSLSGQVRNPPKAWVKPFSHKVFTNRHQSLWIAGSEAGQRLLAATGSGLGFEFGEAAFYRQLQ